MLLKGGVLVDLDPPFVERADLVVRDGLVAARGRDLAPAPGETVVSLDGDWLLPGFVNAHTHLYSALARGLPAPPVEDFGAALEKIWWPLDRALTTEDVGLCAQVGLAEAALAGTTTLVDHHASPEAILGSLDTVASAFTAVGLRGVVCYEATDRNGPAGLAAGLAECAAWGARREGLLRGMIGLHASFTLSDDSLRRLAALPGPTHVHVAEGVRDDEDARARGYAGAFERLASFGLLRPDSVIAHGVHLGDVSAARIAEIGAWLVHNPTSNRNNRVGYARPGRFGDRVALGTDGIGSDMLGAFKEAFYAAREHRHDVDLLSLLTGGHRMASALFGVPIGRLAQGHRADLVRLDYHPPTPVTADTLVGHLLFGLERAHVRDVWVQGQAVVRSRRVLGIDHAALAFRAQVASGKLWARYEANLPRG